VKGNSYIPFMVRRGDGSTLSLDFTSMSALDSRFTFSRSSLATLVSSTGLVRYADHNLFTNTAWLGSTLPTNWALLIGTGTTTWNGDGSVTMTAVTNQRPAINHVTITTINPGLPHTFGYLATNVSGSPQISQIIASNVAGETYAINGVTVASTTVVQSNDLVSCTFTPTTTNVTARIGPGSSGLMSNTSVTASRTQFNIGTSLQSYVANTSTASAYHAPRFDYDPSTLSARGLLIEGSTTNRVLYSQTFATTGAGTPHWTEQHITRNSTNNTDPAGGSTALRITTSNPTGTLLNNVNLASAQRTFSIYLRRVSGTGNVELTLDGGTTWTAQSITSSWARYSITATSTANVGVRVVANGDSIELWGAQVEDGAGASSYIQTGTSTVQRAADSCDMTGSNFSSWFQSGTPYTMLFKYSMNNPADWAGSNADRGAGLLSASFSNPRVFINAAYRVASGSTDIGRFVRVYDSGTLDMAPSVLPAAASNTALVFAVNTNDAAVSAANQSLGTDASCTLLTGYTDFSIGRVSGSSGHLNGCIRQIKYWPTRLPDATLQSLTQ